MPPSTSRGSPACDVHDEFPIAKVADAYVAALEVAGGGDAVDDAVLWRVAEAAAEAGVTDMTLLAQRLREVGIGA